MKKLSKSYLLSACAIVLSSTLLVGEAFADDDYRDAARIAQGLKSGDILPLRTILKRAEAAVPGKAVDADLEQEGSRFEYQVKVLSNRNVLMKVRMNARDGRVIYQRVDD